MLILSFALSYFVMLYIDPFNWNWLTKSFQHRLLTHFHFGALCEHSCQWRIQKRGGAVGRLPQWPFRKTDSWRAKRKLVSGTQAPGGSAGVRGITPPLKKNDIVICKILQSSAFWPKMVPNAVHNASVNPLTTFQCVPTAFRQWDCGVPTRSRSKWHDPCHYWSRFFSVRCLFPYKNAYGSFAINDDGADTLPPPSIPLLEYMDGSASDSFFRVFLLFRRILTDLAVRRPTE